MLTFVPNHLKTEKMFKHSVNKLSYPLRYVPDQVCPWLLHKSRSV